MTFKPGIVTNPNGRPRKKVDPRSDLLEELCKKHRGNIEKVVEVAIKKAMNGEGQVISTNVGANPRPQAQARPGGAIAALQAKEQK